jgi:hypothetical protein
MKLCAVSESLGHLFFPEAGVTLAYRYHVKMLVEKAEDIDAF